MYSYYFGRVEFFSQRDHGGKKSYLSYLSSDFCQMKQVYSKFTISVI